jgi:pilus assembly protein Flp/PilA
MRNMFKRFIEDDKGATAVEYALIVAVLSLAVVVGVSGAFDAVEFLFSDNNSKVNQAMN